MGSDPQPPLESRQPGNRVFSDVLELAQLRRLEIVSSVEATTLLLLLGVGVPLKYLAGYDLVVRVLGPVHGLAFASYFWAALQTVSGSNWKKCDVVRLFFVAMVPFGGFLNLQSIKRRMALLQRRTTV